MASIIEPEDTDIQTDTLTDKQYYWIRGNRHTNGHTDRQTDKGQFYWIRGHRGHICRQTDMGVDSESENTQTIFGIIHCILLNCEELYIYLYTHCTYVYHIQS